MGDLGKKGRGGYIVYLPSLLLFCFFSFSFGYSISVRFETQTWNARKILSNSSISQIHQSSKKPPKRNQQTAHTQRHIPFPFPQSPFPTQSSPSPFFPKGFSLPPFVFYYPAQKFRKSPFILHRSRTNLPPSRISMRARPHPQKSMTSNPFFFPPHSRAEKWLEQKREGKGKGRKIGGGGRCEFG